MTETIIENFFGVYLLYCTNPKFKGRTYIGYTVDPNRRIKQHNKGREYGGAWRTSKKGPWDMVLIVHGFPNDISALRFEWAWQHPKLSRRLQHVSKRKSKETTFSFCLRVMKEMLRTAPWSRLPLTVRWLKQEYQKFDDPLCLIPEHMPVLFGPVSCKKLSAQSTDNMDETMLLCSICNLYVTSADVLKCTNSSCIMRSHIVCLAKKFLIGTEHYIPIFGNCPVCFTTLKWGDLIENKKIRH